MNASASTEEVHRQHIERIQTLRVAEEIATAFSSFADGYQTALATEKECK